MSLAAADFSTITSVEGESFVIETRLLPPKMPLRLPYSAKIVEKIMEYLCYKKMYQILNLKSLPDF